MEPITGRNIRVGIYGTGSWANRTHIPHLLKLAGVEIVALCDVSEDARRSTSERFGIARVYAEAMKSIL